MEAENTAVIEKKEADSPDLTMYISLLSLPENLIAHTCSKTNIKISNDKIRGHIVFPFH